MLESLEGIETGLDPVGLIKVDKNTYDRVAEFIQYMTELSRRNDLAFQSTVFQGMTSFSNDALVFALIFLITVIIPVLHDKHKMPTSFFRTLFSKFSYPILSAEHDAFHKRGNTPILPFMSVDKSGCACRVACIYEITVT